MKERPIVFNGEMVRAILDGRKTQTRRPVKPQPPEDIDSLHHGRLASLAPYKLLDDDYNPRGFGFENGRGQFWRSPFGTVGDRLYVRETWRCRGGREYEYQKHQPSIMYHADAEPVEAICNEWRPSIHMPRWASRIDLEITRVWVERVQDITEEDAKKDGIVESEIGRLASRVLKNYKMQTRAPAVLQFADLWQSIYGTWDANPWVWAYEFRRIKP